MSLSRKPIGLGKTLALAISLCSMGSGAVLAQTELKVIEEALPTLQPIPAPSFAEMQPGVSGSKYARCSDATPLTGESSQKQLQVYIDITARRAQCIEENTYGSAPLYDKGLVDLYQGKYSELNAVLVASQQILDEEKPVSKKQLIDYANYVNEEITLLMVLSAYAGCKALEENSLAMKVDPKCDTERLQEMIVSRNQDGRSQHAHTQSLFKKLELEPFRALPVIASPQELTAMVVARVYRPIEIEVRRELSSTQVPNVQNSTHSGVGNAGLLDPCAWLVALMSNAEYRRRQADIEDAEAAMLRDAARGWRVSSLSAQEGADYARKSGLPTSQERLEKKAGELAKRAVNHEANSALKKESAQVLREHADAEDAARSEFQNKWCASYGQLPERALDWPAIQLEFLAQGSDQQASRQTQATAHSIDEGEEYEEHDVMFLDRDVYTADDIKYYLDRWLSSQNRNDPVIVGPGEGLGRDVMILAQFRPDLALELLNGLRRLDRNDLGGILKLLEIIRHKSQDPARIEGTFRKYLANYWMTRLEQAIDRMETTIQRQIRLTQMESPEILEVETPTVAGPGFDSTGTVTLEPPGRCPRFQLDRSGDIRFWREEADFADAEAAMARENAEAWRRISRQARDGAKQAAADGNASSQKFQDMKADELDQRVRNYDATADEKEKKAKELRRKADDEEEKRCEQFEARNRSTITGPQPSSVSSAPEPPRQTMAPEQSQYVCGPDITDNVLRVLEQMKKDFQSWTIQKRNEKCRDLYNPVTAGTAWDIKQLAPGTAPMAEWKFNTLKILYLKWGKSYQKYLEKNFWFEGYAAACAIPRPTCGFTVRFLGKCMHAQHVNYAQWGLMNKLCGRDNMTAQTAAWLWNVKTPLEIYHSQKVMIGVGRAYAELPGQTGVRESLSVVSGAPSESLDSERKRLKLLKEQMTKKLHQLIANPLNWMFRLRPGYNCSKCNSTAAEAENLNNLEFEYKWGSLPRN